MVQILILPYNSYIALDKSILSKPQLVSCEMWMLLMILIKYENEE